MAPPRIAPVSRYAPITGKRQWLAPRSNGQRMHAGVDLAAAPGTPVRSPEAGRVVLGELDADASPAWAGYGPALVILEGQSGVLVSIMGRDAAEGLARSLLQSMSDLAQDKVRITFALASKLVRVDGGPVSELEE